MAARHDEHYLRDVTSLGDVRNVVAHAPIYGQNHIKLVDIGTRINSALLDKLVSHKIQPLIDQCLTVENGVTSDMLMTEGKHLLEEQPFLCHLATALGGADKLLEPLRRVVLVPALAFKLTVMQQQRPELFQHSLEVAIIALYLGRVSGLLDETNMCALSAAAVFHDIGVLHIDPAILDPAHEITDAERQHIYAHPITAFLILKEYPAYLPRIRIAVLEHHEREDGSGYPRSIGCQETSVHGRMLVLAEVLATLARKLSANGRDNCRRLGVVLKLSNHKYDPALVSLLRKVFRDLVHTCTIDREDATFLPRMDKMGSLIGNWQAIYETLSASNDSGPLANFVNSQLTDLEYALSAAGCHPDQLALAFRSVKGNVAAFEELSEVADEGIWQFRDIVRETRRRWDILKGGEAERQLMRGWINGCSSLLDGRAGTL